MSLLIHAGIKVKPYESVKGAPAGTMITTKSIIFLRVSFPISEWYILDHAVTSIGYPIVEKKTVNCGNPYHGSMLSCYIASLETSNKVLHGLPACKRLWCTFKTVPKKDILAQFKQSFRTLCHFNAKCSNWVAWKGLKRVFNWPLFLQCMPPIFYPLYWIRALILYYFINSPLLNSVCKLHRL